MEKIIIEIKDPEKADLLIQFLRALNFVENVSMEGLSSSESATEEGIQTQKASADFFALAGLWADREITLETLRKKAWPNR